jgi:hypothetical protein
MNATFALLAVTFGFFMTGAYLVSKAIHATPVLSALN